ncbi:MAG: hypothetical protein K6G52_08545, partial [Treponemataceae bacterium]|nr:hypothetical protein [Treponemataceae bacterium]
ARGCECRYEEEDVVVLENYRNYNKDAIIANIENGNVTISLNMANVKKSDVVLCSYGSDAYGEAGSKLTKMSLTGYTPYLAVGRETINVLYFSEAPDEAALNDIFNALNDVSHNVTFTQNGQEEEPFQGLIPYGDAIKMLNGSESYRLYPMLGANTYPDVSNVQYEVVPTGDAATQSPLVTQFQEGL